MKQLIRLAPLCAVAAVAAALMLAASLIPGWMRFVAQIAFATGLVSLGVLMLLRAGLLSFGQGLYYLLGGYAVALLSRHAGTADAFAGVAAGMAAAALCAAIIGLFIARYRGIFFAMLTLALAMIAYGIVLKVGLLGGTDGINIRPTTWLGFAPRGGQLSLAVFQFTVAVTALLVIAAHVLMRSRFGKFVEAVHDNELRLEYLGLSVRRTLLALYIVAGAFGGAGGALAAMTARHVDPSFAYWTTSGEFVFVAVLGGASVFAPFVASLLLEAIRSFASAWLPEYWQLLVGGMMLGLVLFLPDGLWSLLTRVAQSARRVRPVASGQAPELPVRSSESP
jgi:ABC-type branched-subunit amino acid transport system permease subunit